MRRLLSLMALLALATGCLTMTACNATVQPGGDDPAGDPIPDENARFAVFDDPDSDFTTIDVNDVEGELVRFDPTKKSIVWALADRDFQEGSWTVNGNFVAQFQIRFGTEGGERRAYFTEAGPATICDISVFGDSLFISPTNVQVPQE